MKTNACSLFHSLVVVVVLCIFGAPSVSAASPSCKSPSVERAQLCADFSKAQQAAEDQNYGVARRLLIKLKAKVTLSDPLANEISDLESQLPVGAVAPSPAPVVQPKVEKKSERKAENVSYSAYRDSDKFLKRKTWEMINLYIFEGVHATMTGLAFRTLSHDRENKKLLLYMGSIGAAALTLGSTFFYDRILENFRYGVPSGYAFGSAGGIGSGVAAAFLIHAYEKEHTGQSVGRIEDVYTRSLAIGSTVGGLLGGMTAQFTELRPGQMAFISSTSLWGSGMGMSGAGMFVDPDKHFIRPLTGWGTVVGNLVGLATGSAIVYGTGFSPRTPRVLLMNAGYFGGLLSAFYIIGSTTSQSNNQRNRNLAIGSLTGGIVGLGAATLLTAWKDPDTYTLHAESAGASKSWADGLSFGIAPTDEGDLMAQATLRF